MSLEVRIYSILLVSSSTGFVDTMRSLLPENRYSPVCTAENVSAAKRVLAERAFDFVIINSPLSDGSGLRLATDIAEQRNTIPLLLVKGEEYPDMLDRTIRNGVYILAKPLTRATTAVALAWMAASRERIRVTEKKELSFEEKMGEIRVVNRAKWLLISELNMSEPEAHRYIEKQAMDRCIPRRQIAEEIIRMYS
ncbi:MAG: ANTAR domain-containing protein [Lachnospiraceae bacterium]|nr:ANTAR domain-containing protein [Lachnospiraceae bacterium]MCR5086857.1 ANTAR domain-containing protein [Lachnospiraceae bacterium]